MKTSKAKREEAEERKAHWDSLSTIAKLEVLSMRRGNSTKQTRRLEHELHSTKD